MGNDRGLSCSVATRDVSGTGRAASRDKGIGMEGLSHTILQARMSGHSDSGFSDYRTGGELLGSDGCFVRTAERKDLQTFDGRDGRSGAKQSQRWTNGADLMRARLKRRSLCGALHRFWGRG